MTATTVGGSQMSETAECSSLSCRTTAHQQSYTLTIKPKGSQASSHLLTPSFLTIISFI